jgi:type II secretory pathway pseudopilin PulG
MKSSVWKRSLNGFTLIEALIIVTIIGVLAAITAPSFLSGLGTKKVDDVAAQIEGALKEAQAEAIKKSQTCTLTFDTTTARLTSLPANCLPTGSRDLKQLGVSVLAKNESGISMGFANLGSPVNLSFNYKGLTRIGGTGTGLVVIYQGTSASSRRRCIAISGGLGIIRSGQYTGATPENPNDTQNCATNMAGLP